MSLLALMLRSFRNHTEREVLFERGVNLIEGENGSGKTTLLEALYLLSTGRSFLTSHLTDLISNGASHFYVEVHFEREGSRQRLAMGFDGKQRRLHHNATALGNFSEVLGLFPSVLCAPKDSQLLSGAPQERRRFLNIQLAQTDPLYVYHLIRYHKAVRQRNALLKLESEEGMEVWEEMMAEAARYLMERRKGLIDQLRPLVARHVTRLSGERDSFDLHYSPSIRLQTKEEIVALYRRQRRRDLLLKATLSGPHRDDFQITCNQQEARSFASEGQKRCCVIALKLAEWEELKERSCYTPLLAIDDFGVHLDPLRKERLREWLEGMGQVLLTHPQLEGRGHRIAC